VYEKFLSSSESELLYNSTRPVLTGLASVAAGRLVVGPSFGLAAAVPLFAMGVAAEVGGGYIHDNMLGPAMDL